MATNVYAKLIAAATAARGRLRDERGQTAAEYVGIVVLVAAIIGAIVATGIVETIANALETAVNDITGSGGEDGGDD